MTRSLMLGVLGEGIGTGQVSESDVSHRPPDFAPDDSEPGLGRG
jgi:hypothetical protein